MTKEHSRSLDGKWGREIRQAEAKEKIAVSTPPAAPVVAATRATEELLRENFLLSDVTAEEFSKIAAIISKHFAATTAPETAVGGEVKIDFSCRVCGVQCSVAPDPPARAVCPEHCEDHDYKYQRSERGTYCNHCGQQAPEDWYDD